MLLWIVLAALTAGVVGTLLRPLMRQAQAVQGAAIGDAEVYRDQLAEISSDQSRGLLVASEALAARAEVARRLIKASNARAAARHGTATASMVRPIGYGLALAIPLLTTGVYLAVGSPWLPSRPHAERTATSVEKASVDELVAKVEARLEVAPEEGTGWDVVGPIYLMQQRYAEAGQAFSNAIRLLGETAPRLAGLAEAGVRGSNGLVSDTSRKAYERLLVVEPGRADARFWIAVAKEQDGDLDGAAADFRGLAAMPPGSGTGPGADVWAKAAEQRLKGVQEKRGEPSAGQPARVSP